MEHQDTSSEIITKQRPSLRRLRPLEIAGIFAVILLIGSALFEVDLSVRRKPAFSRLFGTSAAPVVSAAPTSATGAAPASGTGSASSGTANSSSVPSDDDLERAVLPTAGVELPVTWGDLGKQLVASGAIDEAKFRQLYAERGREPAGRGIGGGAVGASPTDAAGGSPKGAEVPFGAERGGLPPDMEALLSGTQNGRIRITPENSGTLLNLLWAFGLANENTILTRGPMNDKNYGGAGGFASTGGWTLAKGDTMAHYSKHAFTKLTPEQQALVERVSKGIYRPCCGNSVYFPDCNHGMAMLGLLELMAAQGASEDDMYRVALQVNAYWFPSTYLTLAKYFATQGTAWDRVDPKLALGAEYSSGAGFRQIQAKVTPPASKGGGGCGV